MKVRVSFERGAAVAKAADQSKRAGKSTRSKHSFSSDGNTLSVRVPIRLSQFGGRKFVVAPDGTSLDPKPNHPAANAIIKALGRAFRGRKLLESGVYASIEELAQSEKINPSYVSRVLRLTLLSPEIVEDILAGKECSNAKLEDLLAPFPVEWNRQAELCDSTSASF